MASSKQHLFLIILASWMVAGLAAPNLACLNEIMPCQKYHKVLADGKVPEECCTPLKKALSNNKDEFSCVCTIFNDPIVSAQMLGVSSVEEAMKLPKACGITPDTSKCKNNSPAGAAVINTGPRTTDGQKPKTEEKPTTEEKPKKKKKNKGKKGEKKEKTEKVG